MCFAPQSSKTLLPIKYWSCETTVNFPFSSSLVRRGELWLGLIRGSTGWSSRWNHGRTQQDTEQAACRLRCTDVILVCWKLQVHDYVMSFSCETEVRFLVATHNLGFCYYSNGSCTECVGVNRAVMSGLCFCLCASRERCLLPLQMALESKNTKLGQTALTGMQVK